MFDWMAWTMPVAIFFIGIALMLFSLTVWEIKSPSVTRKGFLPMETSRGDRVFIGLLGAAYINLVFVGISARLMDWLSLTQEPSVWVSFVCSMLFVLFVLRRG